MGAIDCNDLQAIQGLRKHRNDLADDLVNKLPDLEIAFYVPLFGDVNTALFAEQQSSIHGDCFGSGVSEHRNRVLDIRRRPGEIENPSVGGVDAMGFDQTVGQFCGAAPLRRASRRTGESVPHKLVNP